MAAGLPLETAGTEASAPLKQVGCGRSSSLLSESDSFGITLTGTDRDLTGKAVFVAAAPTRALAFEADDVPLA